MKRVVPWLLVVSLISVSFLWGVAYSRYYVFPYSLFSWFSQRFSPTDSTELLESTASGGVSVRRPSSIDLLQTLGYVGVTDVTATGWGARIIDAEHMQTGLSLYTSGFADTAVLMDERGRVVQKWSLPREQVWWDSPLARRQKYVGFRAAKALPDLSLLVVYDYLGLVKVDRNSNPRWIVRNGAHHDFWITGNNEIYVLTHRLEKIPEIHPSLETVVDSVTVLDSDGKLLTEYSLLDLIRNSPLSFLLPSVNDVDWDYPIDILHTNSIQVLDGSLAYIDSRLFAKGNVLVSFRNISTIMIADLQRDEVLWAWGPSNLTFQHSARLLGDAHLLLFDNGIRTSAAVEIDPRTRRRVWTWRGAPSDPLHSQIYGSVERLGNGNTLITDSMQARAFEVSPDGKVVWTFRVPPLSDGRFPVLYGVSRYERAYFKGPLDHP